MVESDYLAGYHTARTTAPTESFEMAGAAAEYIMAAKNSGLKPTETDVDNVMRIMDELGLKTMAEREDLLNNILKQQQAFGGQVSTETMLAAYQHAKQSIYDWSPEFRNKYFPTLLQSTGQQGGTEMATALNNYIGQHMQTSEFKALIGAGFVDNKDLYYEHNKPLLKPGAQLFEADTFKSNIAQWAWDFHQHFMARKDATEGGFEDLIAKMPRNMSGLIAFLVHNEARLKRDAETLDKPIGLKAADDTSLGGNPPAALAALQASIAQFTATVTGPAVAAAGPGLASLAHGFQLVAASYGDWAAENPKASKAVGAGAIAGGAAAGGWLTLKLFTGLGAATAGAEEATAAPGVAAAAEGGSLLGRLGLGVLSGANLPALIDMATDDNRTPEAKARDQAVIDWIKSWFQGGSGPAEGGRPAPTRSPLPVFGPDMPPPPQGRSGAARFRPPPLEIGPEEDVVDVVGRRRERNLAESVREASRGLGLSTPPAFPGSSPGTGSGVVTLSGNASIEHALHIDVTLDPDLRADLDYVKSLSFSLPLNSADTGTMDSDAAPQRGPVGGGQ